MILPVLLLSSAGNVQLKFGSLVRALYVVLQAKVTLAKVSLLASAVVFLRLAESRAMAGKITEPHVG